MNLNLRHTYLQMCIKIQTPKLVHYGISSILHSEFIVQFISNPNMYVYAEKI